MKKKMLILSGPGSVGKSTCIKIAFNDFLQWTIQKQKAPSIQKKGVTVHYLYLTDREVAAVIKIGNESVGIATRGDSEQHVTTGLAFFASYKCKVVICATRSSGKPLKAAQSFASKQMHIVPTELPKLRMVGEAAQETENTKVAKALVKWLKDACS
ncbi:MAG TPA: hypothetical protein VN089_17780 [Duganella sp.]|nr:hypothetical protein [Duganella sp.]